MSLPPISEEATSTQAASSRNMEMMVEATASQASKNPKKSKYS